MIKPNLVIFTIYTCGHTVHWPNSKIEQKRKIHLQILDIRCKNVGQKCRKFLSQLKWDESVGQTYGIE